MQTKVSSLFLVRRLPVNPSSVEFLGGLSTASTPFSVLSFDEST